MSKNGALALPPDLLERLDHLGLEFLAEILGRASARHPDDLGPLTELATILTRLGRLQEGLAADERLVRLAPDDPTVRYNLACSLALLGRTQDALDALEYAFVLGYRDTAHLLADDDIESLRAEPRFQALVARLQAEERA
jgi:tetratricopeptide (TPR) repeat protein